MAIIKYISILKILFDFIRFGKVEQHLKAITFFFQDALSVDMKWKNGWRESYHFKCRRNSVRDLQSHPEKNSGHATFETDGSLGQLRSYSERIFLR